MKITTAIAAVCIFGLCSAKPVRTAIFEDASATGKPEANTNLEQVDSGDYGTVDYTPLMMPMLVALAGTGVDFDVVFNNSFPEMQAETAAVHDARSLYQPARCGMELIISAGCRAMHLCRFMCILKPKVFPYSTCSSFMVNGRCPDGVGGVGSLKGAPPTLEA